MQYTHVKYMYIASGLSTQDSEKDSEKKLYGHLMNEIGWFFFDLLILGYVEDPITGKSFRFPVGLDWTIYVEVCGY